MVWLVVDKNNNEFLFGSDDYGINKPIYDEEEEDCWVIEHYDKRAIIEYTYDYGVQLPIGSIKKLIGRDISFEESPIKYE